MTGPAYADTSAATVSALTISLPGGGQASSGTFTPSNDGATETTNGNPSPLLNVLGSQPVIAAGVLGQHALAFTNGTSAGCAGVVGTGGAFVIGPTGVCTVTNGAQVALTLGTVGLATIALRADAIYGACAAASAPSAAAIASLVNARITSTTLGVETPMLDLPANPAPNTGLSLPGILNVNLNLQSSSGAGQIDAKALTIGAVAGTLVSLDIGNVQCGPNAAAPPVPAIPTAGAPVALGTLAVATLVGLLWWRRRRRTVTDHE